LNWYKKPLDKDFIRAKAAQYNIDLLTAAILARRECLEGENTLYFLEDKDLFLHNPFLLTDMDDAVERIISAVDEREQVAVMGDRDADGITGSALMALYLKKHSIEPEIWLPLGDEPYGLQESHVKKAAEKGITLIICVDNGAGVYKEAALARSYGIDIVIFDHHESENKELPEVYAYVNPRRNADYPNPFLSASAVVHKALFALNFVKTGFFRRPVCLISAEESDDGSLLFIDVMRSINMRSDKAVRFTIGADELQKEKFIRYIEGCPLYMYQNAGQCALLERFFGADVYAVDLAEKLRPLLGAYADRPLADLLERSSLFRYRSEKSVLSALHALYVMALTQDKEIFGDYFQGFDLAGIGLIADIMPLTNENRIIVRRCLAALNRPVRPGLIVLLNQLNMLDGNITYQSVSWRLAPLLNAAGRMGAADKAVDYFLNDNPAALEKAARELSELNSRRRELSESWWQKLYAEGRESYDKHNGRLVFIYNEALPRGLTGLIAGRFSRIFQGSLIIVAAGVDNAMLAGSLRCELEGVISFFFKESRSLFEDCGGHDKAGGFLLKTEKLDEFTAKLQLLSSHPDFAAAAGAHERQLIIDAELTGEHLQAPAVLKMLSRLAPYGEAFTKINFVSYNVLVGKADVIGKDASHLKLTLFFESGHVYTALWWNAAADHDDIKEGIKADFVYNIVRDRVRSDGFSLEVIDMKCNEKPNGQRGKL
jgi:single-stranded-DNA-specific exonuclease